METSSKEGTKRFGIPFDGKQIWTHVSVALVKTLTAMNDHGEECVYGMAFPKNHGELVARLRTPLKKLGIVVFLVSKDGVEVMN